MSPETNPVPFTVRVNPGPPGDAAVGTSGWLSVGILTHGVPASVLRRALPRSGFASVGADPKDLVYFVDFKIRRGLRVHESADLFTVASIILGVSARPIRGGRISRLQKKNVIGLGNAA